MKTNGDLDSPGLSQTIPDHSGQWLPIAQAAPFLGVTERTLRRYVVAGKHPGRRDGNVWLAWVTSGTVSSDADDEHVSGTVQDSPGLSAPQQDMPELMAQAVSAFERTLAAERERSAQLEAELRAAREAAAMYQERSRNLEAQLALPPPARRPWWQWWRRM